MNTSSRLLRRALAAVAALLVAIAVAAAWAGGAFTSHRHNQQPPIGGIGPGNTRTQSPTLSPTPSATDTRYTPGKDAAIISVGVQWLKAYHKLDTSQNCPGWSKADYQSGGRLIVDGVLKQRLDTMLGKVGDCNDDSYWQQLVGLNEQKSAIIDDTDDVDEGTVNGHHTWYVEISWHLDVTDNGQTKSGAKQFSVVTVQQSPAGPVAVDDATPQGR